MLGSSEVTFSAELSAASSASLESASRKARRLRLMTWPMQQIRIDVKTPTRFVNESKDLHIPLSMRSFTSSPPFSNYLNSSVSTQDSTVSKNQRCYTNILTKPKYVPTCDGDVALISSVNLFPDTSTTLLFSAIYISEDWIIRVSTSRYNEGLF